MQDFLSNLFIPHESNNHRAKILHHTNLFLTIIFFVLASFFLQNLRIAFPSILGIATDISEETLLFLTNQERIKNGASPLMLSPELSQAAGKKADDMFRYDYWAHNSPQGKTPWVFIKESGYRYVYAGENLAKGFTSTNDAVKAWMASLDHKANLISSNYKDVGFAVKTGKLNGEETVLIVQELGNRDLVITPNSETREVATSTDRRSAPLMSSLSLSSNIVFIMVSMFIFAFLLDMIIIERKKIVRFVGHNIDHILYLVLVLLFVGLMTKGVTI